ncbi:hypothetical protein [Thalassospira profundimaris]|nr:hypothetical protein [Thalassospira profundimaris]
MTTNEQMNLCAAIANFAASCTTSQCRLVELNGMLVLRRFGGRKIVINGGLYDIPVEGVSIAATSTQANNLYYVYAAVINGELVLEWSSVGHTQSEVTGIEIKLGDETRTLVGMVYVLQNDAWPAAPELVASWYNRQPIAKNSSTGAVSVSSTSFQIVTTTANSIGFLCWADDAVSLSAAGYADCSNGSAAMVAIDGTPIGAYASGVQPQASLAPTYAGLLTEGYHLAGIAMRSPNGGTSSGVIGFDMTVSGHP